MVLFLCLLFPILCAYVFQKKMINGQLHIGNDKNIYKGQKQLRRVAFFHNAVNTMKPR